MQPGVDVWAQLRVSRDNPFRDLSELAQVSIRIPVAKGMIRDDLEPALQEVLEDFDRHPGPSEQGQGTSRIRFPGAVETLSGRAWQGGIVAPVLPKGTENNAIRRRLATRCLSLKTGMTAQGIRGTRCKGTG